MSQGDEFEFQGGAATNPEGEQGNESEKNRDHAHDGMAEMQKSLGFSAFRSFEHGQVQRINRLRAGQLRVQYELANGTTTMANRVRTPWIGQLPTSPLVLDPFREVAGFTPEYGGVSCISTHRWHAR
jgi:hypothetical protein